MSQTAGGSNAPKNVQLVGVDESTGMFDLVKTDGDGRVLVSGGGGGAIEVEPVALANPTTPTAVTVNTTVGGVVIAAAAATRKVLSVFNLSETVTAYLGPSGVTAAAGFPLPPQTGYTMGVEDDGASKALYGITAASTAEVRVWSQLEA